MKAHLHQIPQGSTLHLEGTENPAYLGVEEAGAKAISDLAYKLDVGLSEGGVFATGELRLKVELTCVACLEPFETELVVEPFALQKDLDSREEIDFEPEVREDIQLALPAYPRCDAEGRKTCSASFPPAPAEPSPPSGAAAWEALDKLKSDN